jgi:hypothetical protein
MSCFLSNLTVWLRKFPRNGAGKVPGVDEKREKSSGLGGKKHCFWSQTCAGWKDDVSYGQMTFRSPDIIRRKENIR